MTKVSETSAATRIRAESTASSVEDEETMKISEVTPIEVTMVSDSSRETEVEPSVDEAACLARVLGFAAQSARLAEMNEIANNKP